MASTQYQKLQRLLKELFRTNQADLDFGIYRVINQKRDEVNQFLEKDLLPQVQEAFKEYQSVDNQALKTQLQEAVKQAQALGVDADTAPKVKEIKEQMASYGVDVDELENQVYAALYNFFSRYYDKGDFISQRRYKEGVYAIPYEGEEVKLHWANHDQYYIKTSEHLRNYTFKLKSGQLAHVKLVSADTEKDNRKEADDSKRRFILAADPLAVEDGQLTIRFEYRTDEQNWSQDKLNQEAVEKILALRDEVEDPVIKHALTELAALAPTEGDSSRTLLAKHLTDYTRRNTQDYFIHKDLGKFLRQELDFFIKNEIMHLDDIESETAPRVEQYLSKLKVIRKIAHKIIAFLTQIEDFQKKLWLKKKFVVETNYCITLDRIPEELYPEIVDNDAQREEWVRLFAIDEIAGDMFAVAYSEPLAIEFLQANPYLVLDTKYYDENFKINLLNHLDNLEEELDGLLIQSENFQAIGVISNLLKEKIKIIYLDPPYNTSDETFIYKNQFKHSSWLTMMENRIERAKNLLVSEGAVQIAIDDEELYYLKNQVDGIFGTEKYVGTLVIQSNPRGRGINSFYATSHDYYLVYCQNPEKISIIDQPLSDDQITDFGHQDGESKYRLLPFRRSGGLSTPNERPNSEFSFYYSIKHSKIVGIGGSRKYPFPQNYEPKSLHIIQENGNIEEVAVDHFEGQEDIIIIMPIDTNGSRRVWRWSDRKKILDAVVNGDFVVQKQRNSSFTIQLKDRIKKGRKPKTNWYDSKYDASSHGTILINKMFGERKVFGYPKSIYSTQDAIHSIIGEDRTSICLDFFAGSGTTGHAVINLNREDSGNRKYILVEMGQYFDSVTKPRIQKKIYSDDWNDGKPISRKGSSHAFKYIKLESYEDTLNNLELSRNEEQTGAMFTSDAFREEYLLSYMLDIESQGSLLSIQSFETPFDYKLQIATDTVGETVSTKIDLVETFNYLIGLQVEHISRIQGVVVVEGTTRQGEKTLVIWRNIPDMDSEKLDRFFEKLDIRTRDFEYDVIYVNGDNNLPNLRTPGEKWKVRLIEEDFLRLMFDIEGM